MRKTFALPETESPFTRQRDEFSCGPACLATIAGLYEIHGVDYLFFREALAPDPAVGSCNFRMADLSRAHLPFKSAGENTYDGGVAVANIVDHEGHYVVFLKKEQESVFYYDPYTHEIIQAVLEDLDWRSESRHLKRWTINFAPLAEDAWRKFI